MAQRYPNSIDPAAPACERIRKIIYGFDAGAEKRSAHLVNIAMAAYKDVILHSESDDLRLRAADALLGLAPAQAKLAIMRATVERPDTGKETRPRVMAKRLRALMTSPEKTAELLALVDEAEKQAQPLEESA